MAIFASDDDFPLRALGFVAPPELVDQNQPYTYIEALKRQNLKEIFLGWNSLRIF